MKTAIYARVSTGEQRREQTIENQLHAAHEYAKAKGYEVVDEFKDDGVSGSVPLVDRPEGGRLLEAAAAALFEKVIILCVDRLGRDVVEAALARKQLDKLNVKLDFVLQSFDGTPEGRMQFTIFSAFAEYEKDVITRRFMHGRQRRVRSGRYQASIMPYGYQMVRCGEKDCKHPECGTLQVDPVTAPIVRDMFLWSREGMGLQTIADRLDRLGIPVPNVNHPKRRQASFGWQPTTVYKVLTHPRYIGRQTYGAAEQQMACPAIVEDWLFTSVGQALKRRRGGTPGPSKFYLLRGLLYCRACTASYFIHPDGRGHADYACTHRQKMSGKPAVRTLHSGTKWRWTVGSLDERVKEAVRQLYAHPDVALAKLDLDVETFKDNVAGEADRVDQFKRRLRDLDAENERLLVLARKGHITEEEFVQQRSAIQTERVAVEQELDAAKKARLDAGMLVEAADWFKELVSSLPASKGFVDEDTGEPAEPSPAQWRDLITAIIDKIWVERDGSLTFEGPFGTAHRDFKPL